MNDLSKSGIRNQCSFAGFLLRVLTISIPSCEPSVIYFLIQLAEENNAKVGVKLRAPYVRGALEEARRAARPRRRADPEARVASEVRKAEQERSSSPSETLGDTDKQVIISVPHDQPGLKKEKGRRVAHP